MSDVNIPDWARELEPLTPIPQNPEPDEELAADFDADSPLTIDGTVFPRVASRTIRGMSAAQRKQWDADRFKARTDQLFLSNVLGMDLQENPHRALFAQFLQKRPGLPISDLDPVYKKRMILWSRNTGKTTSLRVEMCQIIINYPNARLVFLTGNDDLAKRQLGALKQIFERPTPEFLRLYPEYCLTSHQNKRTKEWTDSLDELGNQHEFTVPCRTSTVYAEPTFAISTARSVKAGSHFDFIFIDDLVNDQNYSNMKMLDKSYQDYLDICPVLENTGYLVVTGTRYSFGDAYERIQEQAKAAGELSVWKFSIRDCWSAGTCKTCGMPDVFHDRSVNITQPPGLAAAGCMCAGFVGDGIQGVIFPQVRKKDGNFFGFTLEMLAKIKAELGPQVFANQYENNPLSSDTQTFTETMIGAQTLHHPQQFPPVQQSVTFLVGDLAYSEADERDVSVIYTVRKWAGQLFVVDAEAGHWSSNPLVETIIRLVLTKTPNIVYLEKPAGPADALANLITARAAQMGIPRAIPIEWIKPGNQKGVKALRIGNIQAALVGKRLWLYSGMPGYQTLVEQLCRWPRGKFDDYADALGRVVEVPSGYQFEQPPQQESSRDWMKRYLGSSAEPQEDSYTDRGCGSGLVC
jgi:hypothetical protein